MHGERMNTDDTVASTLTPPIYTPVDAATGSDTLRLWGRVLLNESHKRIIKLGIG